ncbi:MAG: tRNA preQ1(34) S-adenosylmethionine ribosyltransferase-isomerase QueA [Deltaproteobacteria bacterium]|nr:tRNA preQ1(34) S-adenosylmethionine ribosyltransferase-isomerase QueA [Deltaproteobacteria bacterium]
MDTSQFDYYLPPDLIAFHPPKKRDGGKLLVADCANGSISHENINKLYKFLPPNTLLIANNSKVIPARLNGTKPTGGTVEVLLVREEKKSETSCRWTALCKANKSIKTGDIILIEDAVAIVAETGHRGEKLLSINCSSDHFRKIFTTAGKIPLPPYIKREATQDDIDRYQTIYASPEGSVAAPTAGLHLTEELLKKIREQGHEISFVTLHVGPGTFRPITADKLDEHVMDREFFEISNETVLMIEKAKRENRPVIAVGTTSVRALEGSCLQNDGNLKPGNGSTEIFIKPPYSFNVIDGLLTNFHLPKSTLLCLVSALAGREFILDSYKEAVENKYRFYSYGDAMLILPNKK